MTIFRRYSSKEMDISKVANYSTSDRTEALKATFLGKNFTGVNYEQKVRIVNQPQMSLQSIKSFSADDEASSIIDHAMSNLAELTNISSFNAQIISLQKRARSSLSGKNLDILLVYLEVVNKSAYFWTSSDAGRSGEGDTILKSLADSRNVDFLQNSLESSAMSVLGKKA